MKSKQPSAVVQFIHFNTWEAKTIMSSSPTWTVHQDAILKHLIFITYTICIYIHHTCTHTHHNEISIVSLQLHAEIPYMYRQEISFSSSLNMNMFTQKQGVFYFVLAQCVTMGLRD